MDLEGSGELVTKIRYDCTGSSSGTLFGADNAEVRFLTIGAKGASCNPTAVSNSSNSPRLTHVTLTAETTGGNPGNSVYGVYNVNAAPVLTDVTIRTDAKSGVYGSYGIYSTNSAPVLTQISVTVAGAIEQTYGIYSNGTLAGASPSMTHVAVTASVPAVVQSRTHVGVYNASNAPIMTDVTVTLSDASTYNYDYGVENYANTGPVLMTNVAVAASGGSGSQVHGVYNNSGWVDMREVVSRAVGGSYAVGIRIDCASAAAKAANAVTALNSVTASGTGAVGAPIMATTGCTTTITTVLPIQHPH